MGSQEQGGFENSGTGQLGVRPETPPFSPWGGPPSTTCAEYCWHFVAVDAALHLSTSGRGFEVSFRKHVFFVRQLSHIKLYVVQKTYIYISYIYAHYLCYMRCVYQSCLLYLHDISWWMLSKLLYHDVYHDIT